jgi:hypothetical protein
VIPHAVGVDDRDRSPGADSKAIRLGPVHAIRTEEKTEFFESLLQIFPGGYADFARRAFRLRLVGAQEDVPAQMRDLKLFRDDGERRVYHATDT